MLKAIVENLLGRCWRKIPIALINGFRMSPSRSAMAGLENYPFLTPRFEVNKSDLYAISTGAILGGFFNADAAWGGVGWGGVNTSLRSIITDQAFATPVSGRQQKDNANFDVVGLLGGFLRASAHSGAGFTVSSSPPAAPHCAPRVAQTWAPSVSPGPITIHFG